MFDLTHLQQELTHKKLTAQGLVERAVKAEGGGRTMTAEEITLFDKITTEEVPALEARIKDIEATAQRREAGEKLVREMNTPGGRRTAADTPGSTATVPVNLTARVPASARRTGVLKAFTPRAGEARSDCEYRAYRAGLWARAVLFGSEWAAQKCTDHGIVLPPRAAMGGNVNTDGGFLVPDELSQSIIDLREDYGVFRQNCRVWPMGSDTLMIPRRAGGVTVASLGENPSSGPSSSTPTFDLVQLVAKKCGGLSILSSEISEDAVIDLADWIANEWAYAFALFEDTIGFTGNGTSTHMGVRGLTALFTETLALKGAVQVSAATHNLFTEIDATDLSGMMAVLPQYARMNAKFYCSSVFNELVFGRLKATAGGNTVQSLQGTTGDTWLGYPIVISQVLPAGASTDYDGLPMAFFGDLSRSSSLGDRRQVRIFPSMHRYMELDQIGILATERIDVVNQDVGTTAVAGPIVALVGSSS